MRLLLWIANTSMASRKDLLPFPLTIWSIKLDIHKLVHVPHDHHVAIQLNNPVIFLQ